ncbi:MAG: alanine racemase [Patescibacteria group bacterium]
MTTWLEINLKALAHNLEIISRKAPKSGVMAIVKANAYGHGMIEVARFLQEQGVGWFGVTSFNEAATLRDSGIVGNILILTHTEPENLPEAIRSEFRLTLYDPAHVKLFADAAKKVGKAAFVHLKIETGLNRLGMAPKQAAQILADLPSELLLEGVFTHFASSDSDFPYTKKQLDEYRSLTNTLGKNVLKHAANSGAIFNIPESHLDLVRPGIALYGYFADASSGELEPVLSWKAKIISVKQVAKGQLVGYGSTYKTKRDSTVAVVGAGYAEGYSRNLSNKGAILVEGVRCPVLGRVAMSMTIIDATDLTKKLTVGDEVILIGGSGNQAITALDLAKLLDTNTHEVLTRIPVELPRVYNC